MTQARLRVNIFILWVCFWVISTGVVLIAPFIRIDVERVDILPAIFSISGVWIPPLSCLAAFWFPQEEQTKARAILVSKERTWAALGITFTYLGFVLLLIVHSTYFVESNTESSDPGNVTLLGQLSESVKIALAVSPIALAPINWLTGGTSGVVG